MSKTSSVRLAVRPNNPNVLLLRPKSLSAFLPEMEEEAREFDTRVAEAIAEDPKIAAHVKNLERQAGRTSQQPQRPVAGTEKPVSGEELAEQFERFLREQRRGPDQN